MIYNLRDKTGEDLVDLEVWVKEDFVEIKSKINIKPYTSYLIEHITSMFASKDFDKSKLINMVLDFSKLQELRGWLWNEFSKENGGNTPKIYDNVITEFDKKFKHMAEKYDLRFVKD